jgi:hypothetical protein
MDRSIGIVVLATGLVIGCDKKPNKAPDPVAPAAAPAVAPPVAGPFLPAKISDQQGIAFAEFAGQAIEAKGPDGARFLIKVGTVLVVDKAAELAMGDPDVATDEVTVAGKKLLVPSKSVIVESRLSRSLDGSAALFSVTDSCGDACHTLLFVVTPDGRRTKLGDGVIDVVAAWRKDGKELAVGSGGLWIVSLPDLAVRTLGDYTAPAYGPDGTLFVRHHDGSGFKLVGEAAKRVFVAKKQPPAEEGDYGADDPSPPTFDAAGKPKFD